MADKNPRFVIFGVSSLRVGPRFGSRVGEAEELQRNPENAPTEIRPRVTRTRVYYRKQHADTFTSTPKQREETVSPTLWCATRDVCVVVSETAEHAKRSPYSGAITALCGALLKQLFFCANMLSHCLPYFFFILSVSCCCFFYNFPQFSRYSRNYRLYAANGMTRPKAEVRTRQALNNRRSEAERMAVWSGEKIVNSERSRQSTKVR